MDDIRSDSAGADLNPDLEALPEASEALDAMEDLQNRKRSFEDLTLLQIFPRLLRHPIRTLNALGGVAARRLENNQTEVLSPLADTVLDDGLMRTFSIPFDWESLRPIISLGTALIIALIGSVMLVSSLGNDDASTLIGGIPLLIGSAWITALVVRTAEWPRLAALEASSSDLEVNSIRDFLKFNGLRVALLVISLIWAFGAWSLNTDTNLKYDRFTTIGVFCWFMSIVTMAGVLLDQELYFGRWLNHKITQIRELPSKRFNIGVPWVPIALMIIMFIGAGYRFGEIDRFPPDMTSDHVEKLLDAVKIDDGERPIFFDNNGGRESFQMYFLAFLHRTFNQPFSFELLKFASGLEGMVMILLAFWMGRAVFGDEDRNLGNLTGLIMAALVSTSYWHTLLSRLGLRIVLTTCITAIVFVFLGRALRYNRRLDYIIAGFALGVGMYFYQAVRMLPLVVIAGIILALIIRARSRLVARQYIMNLVALVLMALMVFLPLGHYAIANPDAFLERTLTRLMGEPMRTDENTGQMIEVPFSERMEVFKSNLPGLADNMLRSTLMFNWRGDSSWFNGGEKGIAAFDFFTGTFFVIGLGIILARVFRRRDPVDLLLIVSILIMLLPSALAVAFTIEVPGFTRASGALPMAYLVAAFGVAMVIVLIARRVQLPQLRMILYGVLLILFLMGAMENSKSYFVGAMQQYRQSSLPHRQAGQILRGFINSTGAPGNAFMISYQYWWDHRALALESGDPKWPNTIALPDQIKKVILDTIRTNENTVYAIRSDRQLMFFLHPEDEVGIKVIKETFPKGSSIYVPSYNTSRDFLIFVVPPVGCEWLHTNVEGSIASCPETTPDSASPTDSTPSPTPIG